MHDQPNSWLKGVGLRVWLVVAALLIYGFLSSPFPDSYRIGELSIGILLVLASVYDLFLLLTRILKGENHLKVIIFTWLLLIPTMVGITQWDFGNLIRDLVPFFYLFIPFFFNSWHKEVDRSKAILKLMPYVYSLVGVVFAFRYFLSNGIGIGDLAQKSYFFNNLMYYSYDPMVTFSSIFLFLTSIQLVHARGLKLSTCFISVLMILCALIGMGSLVGAILRAPLSLIALSLSGFIFRYSIRSMKTALIAVTISLATFLFFQEQFESMFSTFLAKTYAVGENGKIEEFKAILSNLSDSPLVGLGWGSTYYNPVLHSKVRFSHSIISFYFLKTGLIGLLLLSTYLAWLFKLYYRSLRLAWCHHLDALPLVFAIGSTLLIGLLQVTYKTLSYGMVMALIPVLYHCLINPDVSRRSLEKNI